MEPIILTDRPTVERGTSAVTDYGRYRKAYPDFDALRWPVLWISLWGKLETDGGSVLSCRENQGHQKNNT
jgi:hypothetical protein